MRRRTISFRHRLVKLLAMVSLVLCVATAGFWVRQLYSADWVTIDARDDEGRVSGFRSATSWRGSLVLMVVNIDPPVPLAAIPPRPRLRHHSWDITRAPFDVRSVAAAGGFGWGTYAVVERPGSSSKSDYYPGKQYVLIVPYYALVLLTGMLPLFWLHGRLRHRRRKRLGLCPACGYDLRATPGRCPECGVVPQEQPKAAA